MSQQVGVVTFPGSNGDHDAWNAFANDLGVPTRMVDYRETDLDGIAVVVVPGGFSYGDYLRCGAIARFAPVMNAVREFAQRGGPVLGICNGFQVLTEAHLLPGALLRNESLRFHCDWIHVKVENRSFWTSDVEVGDILRLPIAHGDGSYFADDETIARLESNGQVIFRYCDANGAVLDNANPNGSRRAIAGIANEGRNVVGLMPHPERATDPLVGGADGRRIVTAALSALQVAV
ncbi:MAG: phosphoribosylformylglycinamidine synthase subunit PurQ [Thermomicrobiales bacterium]|nr:phosphoribosylformylglycinamidine synthase subunit PurQ [Thermomicrobiales bacterium]